MVGRTAEDKDEDMNSQQDPSSPRDADDVPQSPAESAAGGGAHGIPPGGPDAQGNPAGPGVPPHAGAGSGFFGWVRSLRIVRGQDRWIGGVATGIAARTGLDVILVRGIFVVLAVFGGIGLLAYGLAWALLPEPDGRIHLESAGRGSWTSGMTGALIVSLLGLWRPDAPFFGNSGGFGGFLWSLFWIGVAVFIVYWISNSNRNKKNGVTGTSAPNAFSTSASASSTSPTDFSPQGSGPGTLSTDEYPPATAPTDTYSWTTPPTQPFTTPTRPVAQVPSKPVAPHPTGADVAIFLGGALLFAALVLVLDYVGVLDLGGSVIPVALATAVVVLGIGIVLLGIRGRTSGALGFLAAVGIVATIISSSAPATGNWVLADHGRWSMTAASPQSEGYTVVAGQGRVDLTQLGTITEDVVIPVSAAAGNVGILVPDNVPVEVRSRTALSSTEVVSSEETTSVGGIWQPGTLRLNEDADGPRIILDVRGVVSHVTIATTEDALVDTESGQEP